MEKQAGLQQLLLEQNKEIMEFYDMVSYNLRGPLVNTSVLVKLIEESSDPAEQQLLISKLASVTETVNSVFSEIITSIQIKRDLEIKSEHISLIDCFYKAIKPFKTEIDNINTTIETNFEKSPSVYFPVQYLQNIFNILISNSLKYRSSDRKLIIKLQTKKYNGSVLLSVTDNGLGIDLSRHKDSIFKLGKIFHNHPNARGFGLYNAKTQVEAMNGKIWVESIPDVGSVFLIEFKNQG